MDKSGTYHHTLDIPKKAGWCVDRLSLFYPMTKSQLLPPLSCCFGEDDGARRPGVEALDAPCST